MYSRLHGYLIISDSYTSTYYPFNVPMKHILQKHATYLRLSLFVSF
jgi:hypothetical protein